MNLTDLKAELNSKAEIVFKKLHIKYEVLGDNLYSTCPAHENSDNPRAFSFCLDRGIWKCWTRDCQKHYNNDIFGVIRGALSRQSGKEITFSEALSWINKNILTSTKSSKIKKKTETKDEHEEFDNIVNIINCIDHKENETFISSDLKTSIPSPYFISRGFEAKTLEYFGIGDCEDKASKMYNRAIVPIHNDDGSKIIATIGRSVKEHKIPKFLIEPKGVTKSNILYNLHRAKPHIEKCHAAIIVEGQGDVWRLYEAGIFNAVGMFGKSLSSYQINKINKLPITTIVVLTDSDQAGRDAKVQIKRDIGRMYRLIFPKISKKDIGDMSVKQIQNQIIPQIKGCY